jgi:predicted O-methyltransferase YrrM
MKKFLFLSKLKGIFFPTIKYKPELVQETTFNGSTSKWYYPTIIGPSTFEKYVTGSKILKEVLEILPKLSQDKYTNYVKTFYESGLSRFNDNWYYADINTVLFGLSKFIKIKDYLEIGVRRGRSMAMVASNSKEANIAAFDMWIENYAGMENPGKELVRKELTNLGFIGNIEFFDGDSKKTIPSFFKKFPDRYFDLITVDGDHSYKGAKIDLQNVKEHLRIGGFLVFDDISNQSFPFLEQVWDEVIKTDTRFTCYKFNEVGFGVAIAIRKV